MKKSIVILALLFSFITSGIVSASTVKTYYSDTNTIETKYSLKNGIKHGKYRSYYPNKQIKEISIYRNGKLNGKSSTYYENGILKSNVLYIDNLKSGSEYLYDVNGKLVEFNNYIQGLKDGKCEKYTSEETIKNTYTLGHLKISTVYNNINNQIKTELIYDDNDNLLQESSYDNNGRIHDKIMYQKNIQIKTNYIYKDTEEFNVFIETMKKAKIKVSNPSYCILISTTNNLNKNFYYEIYMYNDNDNLLTYTKALYHNNKAINYEEVYYYDCSNQAKVIIKTDSNKKITTVNSFYNNGQLKTSIKKIEGTTQVIDGTYFSYNENGQMESKQIWKNNKIIELYSWTYYSDGTLKTTIHSINGKLSGINEIYHLNGNLSSKSTYKNGLLEGMQYSYYENGNIKEKTSYLNNKLNGVSLSYYENGAIKTYLTFKNGLINGFCKAYSKNGATEEEGSFINNKKTGIHKIYWENGNIAYIDNYVNGVQKSRRCFNRYGKQLWSQNY